MHSYIRGVSLVVETVLRQIRMYCRWNKLYSMINLPNKKQKSYFIYRGIFNEMTLDLLCHKLENIDWNFVINCTLTALLSK